MLTLVCFLFMVFLSFEMHVQGHAEGFGKATLFLAHVEKKIQSHDAKHMRRVLYKQCIVRKVLLSSV